MVRKKALKFLLTPYNYLKLLIIPYCYATLA